MGLRQKRITGPEYDALIAEFVDAVRERWPNVVIQFEDFHNSHAYDLLDQYKDKSPLLPMTTFKERLRLL